MHTWDTELRDMAERIIAMPMAENATSPTDATANPVQMIVTTATNRNENCSSPAARVAICIHEWAMSHFLSTSRGHRPARTAIHTSRMAGWKLLRIS
jgi:hypothetical protein